MVSLEGRMIKQYRKLRGMIGYQLAEAVGISPEHLYNIEGGRRVATCNTLTDIAEYIGCPELVMGRVRTCKACQFANRYEREQAAWRERKAA